MTAPAQPSEPEVHLTPQLVEVAQMLTEGLTDQQIAARLDISLTRACRRLLELRDRIGARNRTHAVALAYQHGFLQVDGELHARWWPNGRTDSAQQEGNTDEYL